MQLKGMKWFAKLLVMVLAVWLAAVPVTGTQAVLADGVYRIAVLQVGWYGQWDKWDFSQLEVDPGVESYTWTILPTANLTASGLADYNVLIVPAEHGYGWLSSERKEAVVNWVNGGKLLIEHNYLYNQAINDPLMTAFGDDYWVDWTGEWCWDYAQVVDTNNPLVSNPNILSTDNLSHWGTAVHNSINPDTAGSAWNWAADSLTRSSLEERHWLGYAFSGSGAIVICAGDPGSNRNYPHKYKAARMLIENEIVLIVPEESVTEMEIDVKPGSSPNSINPDSKGIIPVAILTTTAFDATTVNATTVTFGPSAATMVHKKAHLEDVDGDGDTDMLLHFKIQDSGIKAGDTEAELTGNTLDGEEIHGVDSIRTVGKEDG